MERGWEVRSTRGGESKSHSVRGTLWFCQANVMERLRSLVKQVVLLMRYRFSSSFAQGGKRGVSAAARRRSKSPDRPMRYGQRFS